ncbi:DNA polymerase III subunit gamma/tau [Telmatobacter sp. DSM 110680]|uniref:DNA polymerase III subunit gamma/tau n=1 Tax=Telmatobacter sp. DSM 110680 TaxID=3036704 RepID=A0AAU7DGP9_9BACT
MGYQVLARKYRPQKFADVAGQDHVTRTLLNALTQNRIAHGYIFSGHRGIGKTTIARILAQALNCRTEIGSAQRPTPEPCGVCDSCVEIRQGNAVDVIEIDAATNRGIDEIRELRDAARYSPARDRYKIYILDEAHQITEAAFNALLKTLEEPPSHIIFMMATTEPENIPQTIRSRCQHFSFHAVKFDDILTQLKMIAGQESVEAEDAALALLAEAGDGSMRDALSIMDQAIASAPCDANNHPVLSTEQIRELMGSVPNTVFEHLLEAVAAGESAPVMMQLNDLLNAGHSAQSLARQIVRYLRNTLMSKLGGEQTELLQISADERARAARTALLFGEEEITRNLQIMLRTFDDLNYRQEQRFHLELGLMKLVHAQRLLPLEELLSGVASGTPVRSGQSSAPRTVATPRTLSASQSTPTSPRSPFGFSAGSQPVMQTAAPIVESRAAVAAPPLPAPRIEIPKEPAATTTTPTPKPPVGFGETFPNGALQESKLAEVIPMNGAPARIETVQQAVVSALAQQGHATASALIATGRFTLEATNLRIEVPGIGKKMLALTVNAVAEKIIKQEVQRLGGPARFMVIPGEGVAATSTVAAPIAGSIQEAALEHPMVQKAKEIFNAEVRSVVDLRNK